MIEVVPLVPSDSLCQIKDVQTVPYLLVRYAVRETYVSHNPLKQVIFNTLYQHYECKIYNKNRFYKTALPDFLKCYNEQAMKTSKSY